MSNNISGVKGIRNGTLQASLVVSQRCNKKKNSVTSKVLITVQKRFLKLH